MIWAKQNGHDGKKKNKRFGEMWPTIFTIFKWHKTWMTTFNRVYEQFRLNRYSYETLGDAYYRDGNRARTLLDWRRKILGKYSKLRWFSVEFWLAADSKTTCLLAGFPYVGKDAHRLAKQ